MTQQALAQSFEAVIVQPQFSRMNLGYRWIAAKGHPRGIGATSYVAEHVLLAEKALGRFLRYPEEVHHVNGQKADNRPSNLVICPDRAYHKLLHRRADALKACGNADYRLCTYCKKYDSPDVLGIVPNRTSSGEKVYHRPCAAAYQKSRSKVQ
jgi:hypothetical protein